MRPTVRQTHWAERCLPVIPQVLWCRSSQVYNDGSFPLGNTSQPSWPRPHAAIIFFKKVLSYSLLLFHISVRALVHPRRCCGKKNKLVMLVLGGEFLCVYPCLCLRVFGSGVWRRGGKLSIWWACATGKGILLHRC